jgi:hypothetical protein
MWFFKSPIMIIVSVVGLLVFAVFLSLTVPVQLPIKVLVCGLLSWSAARLLFTIVPKSGR